ncbi:MAG: ferrous iron transport protein A [Chloroflexota bacterium]
MPAPASSAAPGITRCAICGYEYDAALLTCHAACPLGAHCAVICCPRCGYSTVDPARSSFTKRLVGLIQHRAAETGKTEAGGATRLLDLKPGQCGHVADVDGDSDTLLQLSQYGLLPGTPIRLASKYPVPIVQVGQTDLAIDRSVAAHIFVDL